MMDIQSEKIELAKLILNTDDLVILHKVKSLFKSGDDNWYEELPLHVKQGIQLSVEEANAGKFVSYDDVKKEIDALFK